MFLHSGASLHGHEYSNRTPAAANAANAGQRRHPLLWSAFASTPKARASIHVQPISSPEDSPVSSPVSSIRRARPLSDYIPRTPELVVRFKEPEYDDEPPKVEAMSEDEGSFDVSDSDASRAGSSVRRAKRRAARKSTTYLLAQPPPKLRHKQRLMHIPPKLFLQMQQLSPGERPKPVIDVYPSSAFTKALGTPLLKRFPRIALVKTELSVQDIMLVKVEDYTAQTPAYDEDSDEDNIKSRELVAILSPLKNEDKVEIVLADGTVWVAIPRFNGSYDFVSADSNGNTITARWVRKQVVAKSRPTTPTAPPAPAPALPRESPSPSLDYKYTFSIIDPNCRRHPIMATLTNSSLDILDSYTTVSQSSSRYPPTSPFLASDSQESIHLERTSKPVEDWQRTFISVSAIWVALRHGWVSSCRPTDFIPHSLLSSATWPKSDTATSRGRSSSMNQDTTARTVVHERNVLRKHLPPGPQDAPGPGALPRRATSTGAKFMEKRISMTRENSDPGEARDAEAIRKLRARRAISGDWGPRVQQISLAAMGLNPSISPSVSGPAPSPGGKPPLAPAPLPSGHPVYYPMRRADVNPEGEKNGPHLRFDDPLMHVIDDDIDRAENERRARHQRWRSLTGWFKKFGGGGSGSR